jgi:hypothetical protein
VSSKLTFELCFGVGSIPLVPCTQQSPPPVHRKEIFNLTHQLESMPAGLAQSLNFFIIFTKSEKTTSMSIPFILKELISP